MSQDNETDVMDLPESQLKKSPTWLKYSDLTGICAKCGEHTDLLSPCCSTTVYFEGGSSSYEDLWNEIESELSEQAEANYSNQEDV